MLHPPPKEKLNIFLPAFFFLQSVLIQMAKRFLRPCTACSTEVNGNPDTDFSNRKIESTNSKKARKVKSFFYSFAFLPLQKDNLKRIRKSAKWRNQKHFKLLPMTPLTTVMLIPREQHCCGIALSPIRSNKTSTPIYVRPYSPAEMACAFEGA